jgi:hypothetical protein
MNVNQIIRFLLSAGMVAGTFLARADHTVSVAALVNLTNYQAALLIITDSPPEASFLMTTHKWVTAGEVFDDSYLKDKPMHIEILRVDVTNNLVRAKENGAATFYAPQTTNSMGDTTAKSIVLNNVDFDDVIDLYASIKAQTLLIHPDVKQPRLTLSADASNKTAAVGILKRALQEQGAATMADGDKFEWLVPVGATNIVLPAAIPARPFPSGSPATNANSSADVLPQDSINFMTVALPQLLDVYQALTAQKWIQDKPLPSTGTFTFHNQTPLTKTEILHAFDVLLAWHGLKVANMDDKSFRLVSMAAGK